MVSEVVEKINRSRLNLALSGDSDAAETEDLTPLIKALLREIKMDESLADERDELGR